MILFLWKKQGFSIISIFVRWIDSSRSDDRLVIILLRLIVRVIEDTTGSSAFGPPRGERFIFARLFSVRRVTVTINGVRDRRTLSSSPRCGRSRHGTCRRRTATRCWWLVFLRSEIGLRWCRLDWLQVEFAFLRNEKEYVVRQIDSSVA